MGGGARRALTMGPRAGEDRVTPPSTRPPADDGADHMLVRTVQCIEGQVEIELYCEPVFDYGRTSATWTISGDDGRSVDAVAGDQKIRLQSSIRLGIEGDSVRGRHTLGTGEEVYCSLSWADGLASPATTDDANARMAATTRFWRTWIGRARIPDHRWRTTSSMRSALVIKGLPPADRGHGRRLDLPSRDAGGSGWDYRYSWMRDSTFTLQALR
jgi:GH15 family glucan-1,4-alpha-glucosidase